MVVLALYALGNLDFLRATGTWHPLVRCLSRRKSTGNFGVFWETTSRYFYDPLYLTVTCSEFARGVQDMDFSGRCLLTDSVFNTSWFDSGCTFTSVYGGWSRLQKTADSPQLQFIFDRRHPLHTAVADFHGDVLNVHTEAC